MIIYNGPSAIDGAPIVCVVTRDTKNRKTGDMWQAWVLRADMDPLTAIRTGADASIDVSHVAGIRIYPAL